MGGESVHRQVISNDSVKASIPAIILASTKLNSIRSPPLLAFGNNGNFEVSKMDVLSEEIWHYHNIVTQSESVLNKKLHLRDMLYYSISPVFPMCGLYVVGSSLNGFGNNSSDMDLCLMITNQDLDQQTDAVLILNMVQNAIMELKWIRQQQLICAKVPILRIKFSEPFQDITVDLNVNNSVAIRNTHLLCFYSSFDWRVRPLVTVVKEWAKRHDINDANRSSFTSYSLVLMVIHYLQCGTEPRILPSLQEMYPDRFNPENDVRALNVSSPLEPPSSNEWQFTDTTTLGELLIGFLDYYAYHFDYLRDAISVRLGKKTERALVARQHSPYNTNNIAQWNCICIEEPFTLSNTAHSVHNQVVFDAIRKAFCESHKELDRNRDLKAFLNAKPIKIPLCNPFGSDSVSSVSSTSDNGRDIEHSSDETATNSRSSITSCAESGNETNMISSNEFESADLKKTLFLNNQESAIKKRYSENSAEKHGVKNCSAVDENGTKSILESQQFSKMATKAIGSVKFSFRNEAQEKRVSLCNDGDSRAKLESEQVEEGKQTVSGNCNAVLSFHKQKRRKIGKRSVPNTSLSTTGSRKNRPILNKANSGCDSISSSS